MTELSLERCLTSIAGVTALLREFERRPDDKRLGERLRAEIADHGALIDRLVEQLRFSSHEEVAEALGGHAGAGCENLDDTGFRDRLRDQLGYEARSLLPAAIRAGCVRLRAPDHA